MKSGGGVVLQDEVSRRSVDMVLSGPAGGVAAAAALSRGSGRKNLVTFDMGGTSADFSALPGGEPTWRTDAVIDTFPIGIPVVDVESIGAGGGSLAWIDSGGELRVGPTSAGADPGPIAYGKGGTDVTVTDADLVGGYLGRSLLGGRLALDEPLARRGIEKLADQLHLSLVEAILGVQRVVRASMAKAMRLVLARRGLDPKEYALLAFGGAGPMHAWALARELGVRAVLVPFLPGAFSAYGILISPIRVEYSRSVVRPLERAASVMRQTIEEFRERAASDLQAHGLDPRRSRIEASVDLRFRGQSYEISVPARGDLAMAFRREHRRRYGYASRTDRSAFAFIPEEMGVALQRSAYSPNIKERMDASCALFDEPGRMLSQAEHIPVHLGSMPASVEAVLHDFPGTLREGDQVILNDPYHGGTHLPDVTLVRPVFARGTLLGFAANRAHHADIGGIAPGSMPADASRLDEEGLVLEPQKFL